MTRRAFESPVRAVREGRADVGLALQETAERLGCDFVPLGKQSIVVQAAPDRADREAVRAVGTALSGAAFAETLASLPGYENR